MVGAGLGLKMKHESVCCRQQQKPTFPLCLQVDEHNYLLTEPERKLRLIKLLWPLHFLQRTVYVVDMSPKSPMSLLEKGC